MAEKPDEYELDDYPEREQEKDTKRPARGSSEEKFFQENSLRGENYKKFRIRQKMTESNRVNVRKSFLKGSQTEVKILKRTILSDILDIPYDEVDETKFDLMVEPVDIETFKLYYGKNKLLLEYNSKDNRITILSRDNLSRFKVEYSHQIIRRYAEKEMKTDFSTKSDLSAIDLQVRQSESEKYHRDLNRLQSEVTRLKNGKKSLEEQANQKIRHLQDQLQKARQQAANIGGYDYRNEIIRNLEQELAYTRDQIFEISSDRDRRIGGLMDQIIKLKEDANNEIEALKDSLRIKSTQIIETQNEVEYLREKIEDLEDEVKNGERDNDSLTKELNELKEKYSKEVDELKKQRDSYKKEKEEFEKKLEQAIDSKLQDIKTLVEERDEAIKEKDTSISFQESLKNRINSLESFVEKLETDNASLKLISEDLEIKLEKAKNEIKEKGDLLQKTLDNRNEIVSSMKEEMEDMEEENNDIRKSLVTKQQELKNLEKVFEENIKENKTNIDRLIREKEDIERRLHHQLQLTERVSDQDDELTRQLLQKAIELENLESENQNLTIELEESRSRHRDFVSESETTSQNNRREILKLKTKVEVLENNKTSLQTRVNELEKSVSNYKGILNDANENKKKLQKDFEKECDKLNREKEGLVKDLENKSKNESDIRAKLYQNENKYILLLKKYESASTDLEFTIVEKEKALEREKALKEEVKYKDSRIKAKDDEVAENMVEIKKLEKQIEDANLSIRNSDFYEQQFEQKKKELEEKTKEYNKLVQLSNRQDMDKLELEEEIKILQQEIADVRAEKERIQSKILPPETIEQMKHDIRNLNKLLDDKDKKLKEDRKIIRGLEGDKKNVSDNFDRYKETITRRMERMKEHYERELEKQRKKLAKTISPGELKALNVFLEDLDIEDYDKVDYDTQIKKLRSAREKFKRLIDDPSTDRAHKLQYKYLDDLMQYRIDFLNIEFKKPIETVKGRDYLIRTDNLWSPLGMLKKILLAMKDNPGTTISLSRTLVSNLAFGIFYFVSTSAAYSKKSVVNGGKNLIKITKVKPPAQKVDPSKKVDKAADVVAGGSTLYGILSSIPSYILSFVEKAINLIDWVVENFYRLILAGIITSVTLHNRYGEEMSFPILSFWSFVLAIAIVSMTTLTGFLPSWITG